MKLISRIGSSIYLNADSFAAAEAKYLEFRINTRRNISFGMYYPGTLQGPWLIG